MGTTVKVNDGSYAMESGDWERGGPITQKAAMDLLGYDQETVLVNKMFTIYCERYGTVYAVYNHDGRYAVIFSTVEKWVEIGREREMGQKAVKGKSAYAVAVGELS
jgi:hypothetical protein